VPRYVEFLDELPRTEATQKVRKSELRDRENRAAGLPAPDQASAGSTPMDER
jgi:acyl-coenzyme A synthetase/AMP-(fatty) acid ligase